MEDNWKEAFKELFPNKQAYEAYEEKAAKRQEKYEILLHINDLCEKNNLIASILSKLLNIDEAEANDLIIGRPRKFISVDVDILKEFLEKLKTHISNINGVIMNKCKKCSCEFENFAYLVGIRQLGICKDCTEILSKLIKNHEKLIIEAFFS